MRIDKRTSDLCMSRSLMMSAQSYLKIYGKDLGDLDARCILLEFIGDQHEEYLDLMYPVVARVS